MSISADSHLKVTEQQSNQLDDVDSLTNIPPESPFKKLAFPLNVYAHALLLQEGKAEYLHYGLFQNAQTSVKDAQQFSTDLLLAKLPPPPCRILEVGVGLGKTFSLLQQKKYDVHGITPDPQQIEYIRDTLGADAAITQHSFETFSAEPGSYEVILLQESAQYIDPLVIFNQAIDLLTSTGELIITDEFALKQDTFAPHALHFIDNVIALATRLGFELVEHRDLSRLAAPTVDYLLQLTDTHRSRLMKDLEVSAAQLDQLNQSNQAYREKYASGHYGYALLHFRKKSTPKWRLRFLQNDDHPPMQALFSQTFQQEMPDKLWQWKYATENSRAIGVWRDDKLIAHYGGIGRSILFFGKPESAVQIGDVMVDTQERGSLTRKGPFFLMASTFLEYYIGYGKRYLVGFGFPNQRAMQVAERLKLYGEVGEMVELSWRPQLRSPLVKTNLKVIDRATKANIKVVNQCWQKMAANLQTAIIGLRDWNYIQQRYLNHPTRSYQVILVKNRLLLNPRGVLILRYDSEGCEIVDIIAPLAEIPLLITQAKRLAAMNKSARLFCRITANFVNCFAHTEATEQVMSIKIPTNIWCDGPTIEKLKNRWWLMGGDMDFR